MKVKLPLLSLALACISGLHAAPDPTPMGFSSLFDGKTLSSWTIPEGDNGHWQVLDGVIDYEAQSEAKNKHLWTNEDYQDFELHIDWRIKQTTGFFNVPYVLPNGFYVKDEGGKKITHPMPNADSGVLLRGDMKYQLNIWCWPIGSGEMYGIRNNPKQPQNIRAGLTPSLNADNPVGEWNTFVVTVKGDRVSVELNGHLIIDNALMPGVPAKGPVGLQHHGGKKADGSWSPASSLVQFRNIFIKEL